MGFIMNKQESVCYYITCSAMSMLIKISLAVLQAFLPNSTIRLKHKGLYIEQNSLPNNPQVLARINLRTCLSIFSSTVRLLLLLSNGSRMLGTIPLVSSIITLSIKDPVGDVYSDCSLTVSYDIFLDTTIVPYSEKKSPSAIFARIHCQSASGA